MTFAPMITLSQNNPIQNNPLVTFSVSCLRRLLVLTLLASLFGCAWFQFPGVYRLEIQQGNIITQEMVDQLKPGMSKRQVNFVLGTPLVQDSFNQDRWDYYYSLSTSQGELSKRRFTVYFNNDQLSHVEGDYKMVAQEAPTDQSEKEDETSASL